MNIISGDLLDLAEAGNFDVIVHGCNCFCNMGSGIAKQIKEQFSAAYQVDCNTKRGDFNKLGNFTTALIREYQFIIVNAYTQFDYGTDQIRVDYDALTLVMRKINRRFKDQRIGLPKIGAGLAGGDWNIISKIIETELKDCDVTIVEYNQKGLW